MPRAQLLRLAGRVQGVGEKQQCRRGRRLLGREQARLPAAVGDAAEGDRAGDEVAHRRGRAAQSVAVGAGRGGRGRSFRAALPERQVAAQHRESGAGEGVGGGGEERRLGIAAGAVRQHEPAAARAFRAMQIPVDARLVETRDDVHAAHYNGRLEMTAVRRGAMTDLLGKTALVTGSTDGVGHMVAQRLGARGARVLVHGRDRDRGARVVAGIEKAGGAAEFLPADLASLAEVRALAAAVEKRTGRLDILVNNAGIGSGGSAGSRTASTDGHELRFAVNYLAGFLLTRRLLPLVLQSAPARIVNVSSAGQQPIDFTDVMLKRGYSGGRAYCQSKLAQIMFTIDLAGELAGTGVTVNCLHPATYMDTTMVRQAGVKPWSSVEEGAEAILNLALSPALAATSGRYFNGLQEARANPQAYDAEARRRLKALSFELTGLGGRAG